MGTAYSTDQAFTMSRSHRTTRHGHRHPHHHHHHRHAHQHNESSSSDQERHSHRHNHQGRRKQKVPPASLDAINRLLHLRLRGVVDPENDECLICAEKYGTGCVVTYLPCGHLYHSKCIVSWLDRRCTCPVCRYEFPTDDPEYETGRRERMNQRHISTVETNYSCSLDQKSPWYDEAYMNPSDIALGKNLDMILWKCLGVQDQVGMSDYPSAYLDSHRPLA